MNKNTSTSMRSFNEFTAYKKELKNLNTWGKKIQLLSPTSDITSLYYSGNSTLIINIHGGAFCFKNCSQNDAYCHYLNATYCATVLNLEYTPSCMWGYPVQMTELSIQITQFLKRYGPFAKIIVVGHSSGANLAVSLVSTLHKENNVKINALVLDYPWLDLSIPGKDRPLFEDMWSDQLIDDWIKMYCPDFKKRKSSQISPIFLNEIDLNVFPSTYITTCEIDRLKDDGEKFAQKLFDAKVNVRHIKIPRKHGFIMENMELAYKLPNDPGVIEAKKIVNQEMVFALMAK